MKESLNFWFHKRVNKMLRLLMIWYLFCAVVVINVSLCSCQAVTAVPPICESALLDDMPQRIRKVCTALENSNQFAEALNAYIRKEAAALLYQGEDLLTPNSNGKRTDVDHVFLRFGKKR
ncbi:dromyosuppressin [Uranotaenia lowii]|uniref:dromyosuppressin n=1 Tax=Uranotaenia lowii TaxID=190385 RepID=UPI00247B2233|nr:dromyosuppressin [Uranotaenia lowii]XP_055609069.1 dromyosuppressin [Uranotaenia lowii]